jgi:hypothetical protein
MKLTINLKWALISAISFFVAWAIITERADQVVHFAGELNAMACFLLSAVMGVMSAGASFEKLSK